MSRLGGNPYRAYSAEQKRAIIERLYALWLRWPELRLGQLIMNIFGDIYHVEDSVLIEELERVYQKIEVGNEQFRRDDNE